MGLLDSILGGIAGSALGRSSMGGMGGRRSSILMALLPVVLSMLANRKGGAPIGRSAMPGPGIGRSGGLGGLGAMAGLGGLGALLQRFQQSGYGDQVQSWVSRGENQPVPPEALSQAFDDNELSHIASEAGVSADEARAGLAELLPNVVDHLTPQGQLPEADQFHATIDQFERELQQRTE